MKGILFFVLISLCVIGTYGAVTAPIRPIADSCISSNQTNTNYGSQSICYYNRQTSPPYADFYVISKWNVTLLPSTISSCNISFTQAGTSENEILQPVFEVDAFRTVTNWTESTVTWNTAPTITSQFLTNYLDNDEYMLTIDATEIVLDAKSTGTQVISIEIKGRAEFSIVPIYMKEVFTEDYKPKMVCVYTPL